MIWFCSSVLAEVLDEHERKLWKVNVKIPLSIYACPLWGKTRIHPRWNHRMHPIKPPSSQINCLTRDEPAARTQNQCIFTPKNCLWQWRNHELPSTFNWIAAKCMKTSSPNSHFGELMISIHSQDGPDDLHKRRGDRQIQTALPRIPVRNAATPHILTTRRTTGLLAVTETVKASINHKIKARGTFTGTQ